MSRLIQSVPISVSRPLVVKRTRRFLNPNSHDLLYSSLFRYSTARFGLGARKDKVTIRRKCLVVTRCGAEVPAGAPEDSQAEGETCDPNMELCEDPREIWQWRRQKFGRLLAFMGPALSIPLADCTMSLVDTVCVSQYVGTMALASLAPNTVIFNLASYPFLSLGLATNTLVGRFLADGDNARAGKVASHSLILAASLGFVVMAIMLFFGPSLMVLTGTTSPEVVAPALVYLRIRALAAPAVLAIVVAQSALLSQQDSVTPSKAVLVAASLNMLGDVLLVGYCGMGIMGAAVATVLGQYLCLAILLSKMLRPKSRVQLRRGLPRMDDLAMFSAAFGPLFTLLTAKNVSYFFIQSSATALQPFCVAAHQAVWSLWTVFAFACGPVEQAALAFLPPIKGAFERRQTVQLILASGVVVGITGGITCLISIVCAPHLLTPDAALWGIMKSVKFPAMLSLFLAGIDVALNGTLIAAGELKYLARAMVLTLGTVCSYLFLFGDRASLLGIWWTLVIFFAARCCQSSFRLVQIYPRFDKQLLVAKHS